MAKRFKLFQKLYNFVLGLLIFGKKNICLIFGSEHIFSMEPKGAPLQINIFIFAQKLVQLRAEQATNMINDWSCAP